jgi:hypothetical protein
LDCAQVLEMVLADYEETEVLVGLSPGGGGGGGGGGAGTPVALKPVTLNAQPPHRTEWNI